MPCVSSGHVLSETAGARCPFVGSRLIPSRHPAGLKGACIDGEDRVFVGSLSGGLVISVRTFCPVAGLIAWLRGQAQVAAATPSGAARHVQ
jgi:hypothetical protein